MTLLDQCVWECNNLIEIYEIEPIFVEQRFLAGHAQSPAKVKRPTTSANN